MSRADRVVRAAAVAAARKGVHAPDRPLHRTPPALPADASRLALHVPDEPEAERARWWEAVAEGAEWTKVLESDDGPGGWLWERWRVLAAAGMDRSTFLGVVSGYRRELWYWLLGERTWEQCCVGLLGRVQRRLPSGS